WPGHRLRRGRGARPRLLGTEQPGRCRPYRGDDGGDGDGLMAGAAVSVIVVSRQRPAALARCLAALRLQDHPRFEVIVVADSEGLAAAEGWPVKKVAAPAANVAAARNAGLAAAAGQIAAFIDDDAAAEPAWLSRLTASFDDPAVSGVGGHVIGRNGISLQWGRRAVDVTGAHADLSGDEVIGADQALK